MNTTATYSLLQTFAFDPTRTLTLRNAFVRDMNKRFADLMKIIKVAIVDQDCFGLRVQTYAELTPPLPGQFDFPRTADKVDAFMTWLRQQIDKGLLETANYSRIGSSVEAAWTNIYIQDSYKRGVLRAQTELRKAGYTVPPTGPFNPIEAIMSAPFHIDRVGLAFTRTFSNLKGITNAMDLQISQVLAQGLVDGDGAAVLSRKLLSTITGTNNAELGITDSLGRYIPARRRAQMLARTEIVRAHHAANIQEYENWGVDGITVIAEFVTAGDERVCEECAGYHGNRYSLETARYMIPVHPNCRCIVIPVDKISTPTEVWTGLSADHKDDIQKIMTEAKASGQYKHFGLRTYSGKAFKIGNTLPDSFLWEGAQQGGSLGGASTIYLRTGSSADVNKALRYLRDYEGNQVVMAGANLGKKGADLGEVILKDAKVLKVWKK